VQHIDIIRAEAGQAADRGVALRVVGHLFAGGEAAAGADDERIGRGIDGAGGARIEFDDRRGSAGHGVRLGVVETDAAAALHVDIIGRTVRQPADRGIPLAVVRHRLAGRETAVRSERDRFFGGIDDALAGRIEVDRWREGELLLYAYHTRVGTRVGEVDEAGIAAGRRVRLAAVKLHQPIAEQPRVKRPAIRVRALQEADRCRAFGVVGDLVAGLQARQDRRIAEKDRAVGDVDDRSVEPTKLRFEDVVFGGFSVFERRNLRLRIRRIEAFVILHLRRCQGDLEIGVEHRRVRLHVAELPVGLVRLLLRRGIRADHRLDLLLVPGGVGQLQRTPHAGEQLGLGALVDGRVRVRVDQAAVRDIDPHIAGGVDFVDLQIAGCLLQIDIPGDRVCGAAAGWRYPGYRQLVAGDIGRGRRIDQQRVRGAVADIVHGSQVDRAARDQTLPAVGDEDAAVRGQRHRADRLRHHRVDRQVAAGRDLGEVDVARCGRRIEAARNGGGDREPLLGAGAAVGIEQDQPGAATLEGVQLGVVELERAVLGVEIGEIIAAAGKLADRAVALVVIGHLDAGLEAGNRAGIDRVVAGVDDRGASVRGALRYRPVRIEGDRGRRHVDLQRPAIVADAVLRLQYDVVAAHDAGIAGRFDRPLRGNRRRPGRVQDRPVDNNVALGIDRDRALR